MDNGTQYSNSDMVQFQQMFFEEAEEHLNAMESLLLEIDLDAIDDEAMNAIFRAAHSIKGGSATFGFSEISGLTHVAENLLAQVRNHTLEMTNEMVEVLLKTGDAVRQQLQCRREGNLAATPNIETLKQTLSQMDAASVTLSWYRITAPLPEVGLSQEARDNLYGDLNKLGTLAEDPEGERQGMLCCLLKTSNDPDELCSIIDYLLVTNGTTVEPYQRTQSQVVVSDPGYGLFEDAAGSPAPQAYGLFSEEEGTSPSASDAIGYGFFEAAPGAPAAPLTALQKPVAVAAVPSAPQKSTDEKPATRWRAEDTSIRVGVEKVDQLVNLVGELVITQAGLLQNATRLDSAQHAQLFAGFADLERHTRDLQESVMSIRMLPISNVFNRFPRMLRDLAGKLGKQVELKTIGESTELDKGLIEHVTDPLTHLVRNSLDHGIELPATRLELGKPAHGTITLKAAQRSGNIVIEVCDDGGGLRREKIIAKARERGLPIADDASDSEVWNLIFAPGFSTAEQVTDVSGRGVGMDVVKRNIIQMGGSVEISSVAGQGTNILIKLPLTMAIMDGMSVAVGNEVYILPLGSVIESISLSDEDLRSISGHGQVIEIRQEFLPVLDLHEVFQVERSAHAKDISVLVEADGIKAALLVDELVGQQQVVVKNLESNYRKVPGVSGATIMGDGSVALILDVAALVKRSRH